MRSLYEIVRELHVRVEFAWILRAIEYSNLIYLSSVKELFIVDINFLTLCQFDIKVRDRNLTYRNIT